MLVIEIRDKEDWIGQRTENNVGFWMDFKIEVKNPQDLIETSPFVRAYI